MRIIADYWYRKGCWSGARTALLTMLPVFLVLDVFVLVTRTAYPLWYVALVLMAYPTLALGVLIYSLVVEGIVYLLEAIDG